MLYYFLKTILLLGAFYMMYSLLLRKEKSFRWNRFYLLFTSFLSMIIPLISLKGLMETKLVTPITSGNLYNATLDSIINYSNALQSSEIDYIRYIFIGLLMGMLWGITRVLFGLYIISKLKRISTVEKISEATVHFNTHIETPFSFFSYIFIPETFRNKEVLPLILKHEEAHISLKHSFDKFYFSLLQAIFWFNPFVYLYHKEMELQHEFEADAYTVKQIDTDHYVKTLLETVTYNQQTPTALAHHFFHHPLKTRITMLYKKSNTLIIQKSLIIVSTLLLLSLTLLIQSHAQNKKTKNPEKLPESVTLMNQKNPGNPITVKLSKTPDSLLDKSTVDAMPQFRGGEEALNQYIAKQKGNFSQDEKPTESIQVQLVILSNGMVDKVAADPFLEEKFQKDVARIFKNMPAWKPGLKNGKPVPVITFVTFSY